ncbi:MAG TPA: ABC transporter permease [Bryobacteraceae bacterium]|nr:ABC transporter permease [Bryobacteraceae bacterium]
MDSSRTGIHQPSGGPVRQAGEASAARAGGRSSMFWQRWLDAMPLWFSSIFRRRRLDAELDEELNLHVDYLVQTGIERGLSPDEARFAALRQMSGIAQRTEECRDMRNAQWLDTMYRDACYAVRALRRNRAFAFTAVLTLGLGIGANTALFSLVNAVFLKPLPYERPDELVTVWEADTANPERRVITSAPNFADWREQNRVFSRMALWEPRSYTLRVGASGLPVPAVRASASLFPLLGISPAVGRTFSAEEEVAGRDRVVVLSHWLWKERFGADPGVIGRSIEFNKAAYTVIGVMPPHFRFPDAAQGMWIPIGLNQNDADRSSRSFRVMARLKPGVGIEQARSEMRQIGQSLARAYPGENQGFSVALVPMAELGTSSVRRVVIALFGAVGVVLLIVCANLANLLLARGAARHREMSLRAALGAERGRLVRQLLTESLVIAACGCACGLLLGYGLVSTGGKFLPGSVRSLPFRDVANLSIDGRVLAFTTILSAAAALLFGLIPALRVARFDVSNALRAGGRGTIAGGGRMRQMLVAGEVALALVLLAGAALLVRSMTALLGVNTGLTTSNVLVTSVPLPQADFYGPPERRRFCQDVREAVGNVPGVTAASAVSNLPFTGSDAGRSFIIAGHPPPATTSDRPRGSYTVACPGYFGALGIPILHGRDFTDRDTVEAEQVVVINETMARRYWGTPNAVGQRIKMGRAEDPNARWMTVVGIVRDTRRWGHDSDIRPESFRPYSQAAWPGMTITVRTAPGSGNVAMGVSTALSTMNSDLAIGNMRTMDAIVDASVGPRRFPLVLLSSFALLALLLAAVGIYGVSAYVVEQRTAEIGMRVALGAKAHHVTLLVLRRSLTPILTGAAGGLAIALASGRVLEGLLYGVEPNDPLVLAGVAAGLIVVGTTASLAPARRAACIDPVTALRHD